MRKQKINNPPALTDEEKSSLENFFRHWRLDFIELNDTPCNYQKEQGAVDLAEFLDKARTSEKTKVRLTLRKKRASSEKLTADGDRWRFDNSVNQVGIADFGGGLNVNLTTEINSSLVNIPGFAAFLKGKYSLKGADNIIDGKTLEAIRSIVAQYRIMQIACETLQELLKDFPIHENISTSKLGELIERKKEWEHIKPIVDRMEADDFKQDPAFDVLRQYEEQFEREMELRTEQTREGQ